MVYQVLEMSIKSMSQKGVEHYKRDFICTTLAMSVFRVPEFRSMFLSQLEPLEVSSPTTTAVVRHLLDEGVPDDFTQVNQIK